MDAFLRLRNQVAERDSVADPVPGAHHLEVGRPPDVAAVAHLHLRPLREVDGQQALLPVPVRRRIRVGTDDANPHALDVRPFPAEGNAQHRALDPGNRNHLEGFAADTLPQLEVRNVPQRDAGCDRVGQVGRRQHRVGMQVDDGVANFFRCAERFDRRVLEGALLAHPERERGARIAVFPEGAVEAPVLLGHLLARLRREQATVVVLGVGGAWVEVGEPFGGGAVVIAAHDEALERAPRREVSERQHRRRRHRLEATVGDLLADPSIGTEALGTFLELGERTSGEVDPGHREAVAIAEAKPRQAPLGWREAGLEPKAAGGARDLGRIDLPLGRHGRARLGVDPGAVHRRDGLARQRRDEAPPAPAHERLVEVEVGAAVLRGRAAALDVAVVLDRTVVDQRAGVVDHAVDAAAFAQRTPALAPVLHPDLVAAHDLLGVEVLVAVPGPLLPHLFETQP